MVGVWRRSGLVQNNNLFFFSNLKFVFAIDGWVYTNDAWLGPRPMPYTSGGGSVTRRRRWVRRVWFDEERYKRDS